MAKRKYGEGSIFLRKDGRWEGRVVVGYKENGNPKTKSVTAKTQCECKEKLQALKEQCGRTTDRLKPDMPFGDWMDFWFQNFSKPKIRETTMECYENRIYNHIIPEIGKIPLCKLTQNDLQQFYARLKKGGRRRLVEYYGEGLSDRMVRSCHTTCRTALEKAVTEGLITTNPAIGCRLPPKKAKEMQVLTQDEIRRFLIQANEEGYYEFFLLELTTGMRRGEILGLQWKDVNFATGELHIRRQVVKKGAQTQITKPKTKSSIRTLILPPDMLDILAEHKKNATCEWVFPSPVKEGEPRNPDSLYGRFQKILKRAQCKKVRFHDLRHTFATMALENGMDIKTLSAMIGHISAETTLNIYSHITDTMQRQAAVTIDREIGGTDAQMPEPELPKASEQAQTNATAEPKFEPYKGKIRKPGTGCVYQINDTLWEGSFYPRMPDGKRKKFNVYAETREQCEAKLAEMIAEKKAEIAEEKAKRKEGAD
ncbi:MAG TPA: site-specific integrase [Clostridiales bacterium]|nr:site-specific integrase [Candidatus Apopatosoma intestinale]